jgi:thiol-disulfide isomerase/thioredoxin
MIASLLTVFPGSAHLIENRSFNAWLETPGGHLQFGLDLEQEADGAWSAFLVNGEERIAVPKVEFDGKELLLEIPHYDSRIRAHAVPRLYSHEKGTDGQIREMIYASTGDCLEGEWEKRRSESEVARLPFRALQPPQWIPCTWGQVSYDAFGGRWSVDFETDDELAVAVFHSASRFCELRGTFLTATGDFRYLSGWQTAEAFGLSCFDGAHAFLFSAKPREDGTLAGDFWSGNWHHETWTAKRDENAQLADPFAQTRWNGTTKLADLTFPDLDGKKHSLGEFAGKATLLVVFGSWCPNCNDEAKVLAELDAKYKERGLCILGLAFELTGEPARDAEQVRIFANRHELTLPFFLCGTADKDEATKALGLVDRVRAFPTTIFVGADGLPKAIHSGFAGPATGEEHQKLRRDFEARIEALLR